VTSATFDASPPAAPSAATFERVLAAGGSVAAALLLLLLSVGTALVALAGIGVIALVYRARRLPLTRRASWVASVATLVALYGAVLGVAMRELPADFSAQMQAAADSAQNAPPPPAVERMRRYFPVNPAVERQNRRIMSSRAFSMWIMVMTIGTFVIGGALFIGTCSWLLALVGGFALRGRWPMPPPSVAPRAFTPSEPIPLIR
jgi:hypothetical protein